MQAQRPAHKQRVLPDRISHVCVCPEKGGQGRGNKQLAAIDEQEAKRKWREDLPVSLKEMAVALEVGYDVVLGWRRQQGFPFALGKVFPSDFGHWRRGCLGIPDPHIPERLQHSGVDKPDGSSLTHDLPASLPRKAARLAARAGLCR